MDTALSKKLMLEKFPAKLVLHQPHGLKELEGLGADSAPLRTYDFVMDFVFSLDEMESAILAAAKGALLREGGYLYLCYPKKGNKRYPQAIDRDDIIARFHLMDGDGFMANTDLKFSKMLALNGTFTVIGLKRMSKQPTARTGVSQCVEDYAAKIPDLRGILSPHTLALYDALSPGYQKDWARYVYSAQTNATREKHLLEMADILSAGYKSKDLYRRAQQSDR